jgi:murein L,D-transpeptidase YafK
MLMKFDISMHVCRFTRIITDAELASNREEKRFSFGATLKRCDTHFAKQMSNTVVFIDALEKTEFEAKKC